MNKKLTYSIALAFVLILSIASVSAGIFGWLEEKEEIDNSIPKIDSLITMNVSDKIFTTKITNLNKGMICIKDLENNAKIVKADKCEKDKTKYTLIDISDSSLLYENSQGLVRIRNE